MRKESSFAAALATDFVLIFVLGGLGPWTITVNPFMFWVLIVAGLAAAAWLGRGWYEVRRSTTVCVRCGYPLEGFMVRCPECGLGKDGSEPPTPPVEVIVVWDPKKS